MTKQFIRLLIPVLILAVAGGALWFVLIRPTPTTLPQDPADQLHKETFEEEGRYYTIEASYPLVTPVRDGAGISADTQAVNLMTHFIDTEVTRFKEDTDVMNLTPEEAAQWGLSDERKYALGIDYREYATARTVSYVFDVYLDTGGAHPNAYHRTFTFDRTTGASLTLRDLFEDGTDYLSLLSERARTELPGIIALKGGITTDEVDTAYIAEGTTPVESSFQTFYLADGALILIFSPYQVGPWVIGTQELSLPLVELPLKASYR